MKRYNKLVRDKIPGLIEKEGTKVEYVVAKDKEYWKKLKEKLAEEVLEFSDNESVEELADILEVIEAICRFQKISPVKLAQVKQKKKRERGGFAKRYILRKA